MSAVLQTLDKGNGITLELVEYDDPSWAPWTHCIRQIVADGKHYQRPGQRTCTGWSNYENFQDAVKNFR